MTRRIEAELEAIEAAVNRLRERTAPDSEAGPLEIALALREARQARDAAFPPRLFGDPAWDLLLEAFIATEQGNPLGKNGLIEAAGLPYATGARWIDRLEEVGLLTHRPIPDMKRRRLYGLTDKGLEAMTRALARMA